MVVSAGPNITGPTLDYSTYYYNIAIIPKQLMIYSIAQQIRHLEAGKSQGKYPELIS